MRSVFATAALVLGISAAFSQSIKSISGFHEVESNCYFKRCSTENEAIRLHSLMLDFNGLDTTFTKYDRGNNPIAFSYYRLANSKIAATFIINNQIYYDVWFMEVDDRDTHFVDVIDNSGAPVELIYIKP